MKKISIIVAIDKNGAIGFNNELLFWLPNDLKHFKKLTTGNTIIMGRRTFESLPKGALPNRRNIVLTSNETLSFKGAEKFSSLEEAINNCGDNEHIYIIGGAQVYRQAINMANELCITEIDAEAKEADAYFPKFSREEWQEKSREVHLPDEKHLYSYAFVCYNKK